MREGKRLAGQRPSKGDSAHEGGVDNSRREEGRHWEAGVGGGDALGVRASRGGSRNPKGVRQREKLEKRNTERGTDSEEK